MAAKQAGAAVTPVNADQDRIVYQYLRKHNYDSTLSAFKKESGTQSLDQFATNAAATVSAETGITNQIAAYRSGDAQHFPDAIEEAYGSLSKWIESSLDQYRNELYTVTYPIFVHCYLDLVAREYVEEAKKFIQDHCVEHEQYHDLEIRELAGVTTPEQMASSDLVSALRTRRYTLQLCSYSQELFLAYLMEHKFMALLGIVNQHIELAVLSGKASQQVQAVRLGTASEEVEMLNKKHVYWGQLKQSSAVEEALEDDGAAAADDANPEDDEETAKAKKRAKRPKTTIANGAPADRVPLPPARGRELQMKIEQLKEIRKRVELNAANLPSACLYSFFNATDRVHCLNMSEDATMIAAGFADSYIKIWSLDAKKPLRTLQPASTLKAAVVTEDSKLEDFLDDQPEESKTLIGHAGPVYETSFSPDNSHLVSCSEDGTVRLWNLATFTNVVCYKGHMNPVWSVSFSPLGYYFATASHDRTARLWSTDHIYPLRLFAGHLSDVDVVKFHPNTNYIATGSTDKSCRLWDVTTGECVRVFEGHTGTVHALAFSEDGKYLASGGDDCNVLLWNLGSGKQITVLKGHRDVIYTVSFSGDGTLIASGSADKTLRLWAARDAIHHAEEEAEGGAVSGAAAGAAAGAGAAGAAAAATDGDDGDDDDSGGGGGGVASDPPTFRKRRMLVDYDSDDDDDDDFTTGVKQKNSTSGVFGGGGGAKRAKNVISFTSKFTLARTRENADDGGSSTGASAGAGAAGGSVASADGPDAAAT